LSKEGNEGWLNQHPGRFNVNVRQPDSTYLRDSVVVY
jgi:hypothetical protein